MGFEGNGAVLYEKQGAKAYITLNRPEAMNAHNAEMREGLLAALADFRDDPDLRVAILTGAGGRAFAGGRDLKELSTPEGRRASREEYNQWDTHWTESLGLYKPVIGAIDGYALGGGFELALKCDIRIATEQSKLGQTEPRFFASAGGFGPRYLASLVPVNVALYMQLTGAHIPAATCFQWGVIQELVPDRDTLMERANWIADQIIECHPGAAEPTKKLIWDTLNQPIEYIDKYARAMGGAGGQRAGADEPEEGARAFAEGRKPDWRK